MSKAATYFQWPFIILNVSQGVIIFVLLGIVNSHAEWKNLFLWKKKKLTKSGCSNTHQRSKGTPLSNSSGTKETGFGVITKNTNSEFASFKEQVEIAEIIFSDPPPEEGSGLSPDIDDKLEKEPQSHNSIIG